MKKLFFALFILAAAISLPAQAQEKNFIDQNYVEVTGSSIIKATPDIVYLNITINEKQGTGKQGLEKAEKEMVSTLKSLGIDIEKDLTVSDFSSSFLKRNNITLSKDYILTLRDISKLNDIYTNLEASGIANVNVRSTDLSNRTELRLQAKKEAVIAAKEKAAVLVEAAGRNLGKALYIIDYDRDATPVLRTYNKAMALGSMANESVAMDEIALDFNEMEITANITIRFAIID